MDKFQILQRHRKSHDDFVSFIMELDEAKYTYRHLDEKWSAGEQLDHLNRTVGYLARALKVPKFLIRYKFGKSNRPSKTFDGLVAKYTNGIQAGFKATAPFIPDFIELNKRQQVANQILKNARSIEHRIGKYSETNLDKMILPHPALGILTIREMMYFSIHHMEDHLHQTKRNLASLESGLQA
jgi:hypothetical protein